MTTAGSPERPDRMPLSRPLVVVLGEVLVELSSTEPFAAGGSLRLGFSGDALNVAAAAAAGGARAVLMSRVPDDELGEALVLRCAELGVDTSAVVRSPGHHGVYFTHADPLGARQFAYARAASVGASLSPDDLDADLLADADVVVTSGITAALSGSAREAVRRAATLARRFVYDPNYRPRLTTASAAGDFLREIAPQAEVITPSWPGETTALLGLPPDMPPRDAATAALELGSRAVVLTCGADGAVVVQGDRVHQVPAPRAAVVVDQTGAGDCLTGTMAARLAAGDSLDEAVRLGAAAASLSVSGQGGTGHVPTLDETRRAAQSSDLPATQGN
ncbi:sugar kinase [Intrasporangium chromatireducens]|nr:sugar kinase [Intrasporangium chromatireducens]